MRLENKKPGRPVSDVGVGVVRSRTHGAPRLEVSFCGLWARRSVRPLKMFNYP